MAVSFTWIDVKAILMAVFCFAPYLLAPGYVVSRITNLFNFRKESAGMQIALSLVVSLAIVPVCINLLARVLSIRTCSLMLLVFSAASVLLLLRDALSGRRLHAPYRSRWGPITLFVAVWLGICLFTFPDLQIGSRLWSSVVIYDQAIHSAFVDAVLRSGTPPDNPLCFFGQPVAARYYYYWSTICALPAALCGLDARATLAASSFWCGLSLAALIPIYLKYFAGINSRLRSRSFIGASLLCVTGLDLIPTALTYLTHGFVHADMDWWSNTLIPSWVDSLLWTPHHVAGLVTCLFAFLLIWNVTQDRVNVDPASLSSTSKPRKLAVHLVLAALAFASAAGLSVYITLCFLLFLCTWLIRLMRRHNGRAVYIFLSAGMLAFVISTPFLHDLRQPASHFVGARPHANHLFTTGIRTSGWVKAVMPDHHFLRAPLLVLDMGVTYCFELGFYLIVLILTARRLYLRRERMSESQKALSYLLIVSLVAATFIRSEAIRTNDFGIRSVLLVQWVLLLWSIPFVEALRVRPRLALVSRPLLRQLVYATLLLGLGASIYQVLLLRLAAPIDSLGSLQHPPIDRMPALSDGHADAMIRSAYSSLDRQLTAGAVTQYDPFNSDALQMLTYTRHQLAAATADDCGTAFGGTAEACALAKDQIRRLFAAGSPPVSAENVDALCRASFVNVLIVQQSDPVWQVAGSWVWQRTPLISNDDVRIFRCGGREMQ